MVAYTVDRLLSSCSAKLAKQLKALWAEGGRLSADKVPRDALVPVVILAAWGQKQGIEVVDDYDALLEKMRAAFAEGGVHHPDSFFASSICIMAQRGQELSLGGFTSIGIPEIYEELFGTED
jgi:hypothetical protein